MGSNIGEGMEVEFDLACAQPMAAVVDRSGTAGAFGLCSCINCFTFLLEYVLVRSIARSSRGGCVRGEEQERVRDTGRTDHGRTDYCRLRCPEADLRPRVKRESERSHPSLHSPHVRHRSAPHSMCVLTTVLSILRARTPDDAVH